MKKRSLFKRLLSGFVATAMALSICFSDKVFEDLFASAAEGDPSVKVDFYDDGELAPVVNEDGDTTNYKYFVLGVLVDKNAGPKVAATSAYVDQFVAWDCKEIDPKTNASTTVTFDKFYVKHADYKKNYDRVQPVINNQPGFDMSNYKFLTRVYRYWVKNQWGGDTTNPHTEKSHNPEASGVEPTNLISPEEPFYQYGTQIIEHSADTIPGYVPSSSTDGNTTNVRFDKKNIDFKVRVNFGKLTQVKASDNLYVLVEVEHQNHDKTYFFKQITTEDEVNDVEYTVQDKNNHHWIKQGQVEEDPHEHYHGNEPSTKIRLFKTDGKASITSILNGVNCTELKTGDIAKGQKITINGTSTDPETPDEGDAHVTYYETITLDPIGEADNYTYKDVLGSGIAFGIAADRYVQNAHAQTNYAANYFKNKADNVDPDLSDPSAGEIYVANFVNFDDPTDLSADNTGKVIVGNPRGNVLNVNVPDLNRVYLHDPTMKDNLVKINKLASDTIKNDYIDPTIQQMQAMSNRLASKPANVTPVVTSSHYIVNTMDYDDDATIYVDGDAMYAANSSLKYKFIKKEGQMIVVNYTKTKNVVLNEFTLEVTDKEGNVKTGDSSPDGKRGSNQNVWLDQQVMRKVVWNLNSVENTAEDFKANKPCVTLVQTAGMYLIPKAQTVTHVTSTSSGWLLSAGYVENKGSAEWHFPYSELEKFEKPKTTSVVISKKAVTGDDEIPGATLQIVDKVTGDNIGSAIWESVIAANGEGFTALTTKIGELEDVVYGMQWTSGETAKTITLRDGSYVLKETGTTFKSGGKEYKVVTSSFDFEITNGKITKVSKNVTEDNGSITYEPKDETTLDTITIRDAQVGGPVTHPVHVSKTEITGQKAVAGATITVYTDTPNVADRVKVDDYETRAVDGSRGTFMLEAGKYVLVEKATVDGGAPSLNGKTYKVITTEFKFEVKEDGTVECTGAKASVDNFTKDEKANGGLVLTNLADNNEPYFIMCDAANTTNITVDKQAVTGEHTIKNARLWLTDSNGDIVPGADITTVGDAEKDKFTVALEDGEYTIHEDAAKDKSGEPLNITDENGDKYNIIPSEVKFTVVNGTVTETEAKASKDELGENGGVFADGTTFHVCDAVKPKTNVKISKTDVTGNEELKGATLTLFYANEDGTKGAQVTNPNNPWTSDGRAKWTVQLQEGKYILEESGTKVTDSSNWEYDILNSAVAFTIDKDGNITVTSNNSKTDFDKDNSSETGFAVAKNTADHEATLTICDAAKKTTVKFNKKDITGQEELAGATLTVYKYDDTKTDKIGTEVDGKESSKDAGSVFELELANGKYVLKESGDSVVDAAGNKYDIIETTLTFEVNNGTVTATGAKTAYDDKATTGYFYQDGTTIEICDAAKKTTVKFNKKDITGQEELAGATLTVYKYDATKEGGIGEQVDEDVSSKEAGSVFELELANGKYVLKESGDSVVDAAGNKYDIIETTLTFEVNNGTVTATGAKTAYDSDATTGYFYKNGTTIEICDAKKVVVPDKLKVKVDKTAVTGEAVIENAHLKIVDSNNVVKGELITTKTKKSFEVELEDGTYTLTEEPVDGKDIVDAQGNKYKVIPSSVTFTIENGQITSTTKTVDSKDKVDQNKGGVVYSENTFTVCDAQYSKVYIHLSKKDITGANEVKNAVITLYNAKSDGTKGDKVQISGVDNPWTSNGSTLSFQLEKGNYILEESGDEVISNNIKYKVLSSTVNFSVDENGKVTVTSNNTKPDFVSDSTLADGYAVLKQDEGALEADLTICDAIKPKTAVTISKTDVTGNEELAGATLTLYYANEDGTKGAQVTNPNNPWTSDGRAKWTVQLQEGKYILEESGTKVTDSSNWEYDILNSAVAFTIDKDGNITVTSNNSKTDFDKDNSSETGFAVAKNTADHEATLTICDAAKKTTVKFNKKDITGQEELAGATLTVYKYDDTKTDKIGTEVDGKESSKDAGSVFELELANGKYVLKESGDSVVDAAGNKYDIIETTLTFEVNNGTVTATGAKTAYDDKATTGYFYQNGTTIEICDAKKVVVPEKLKVKVDKKAITGDAVIENAVLKIVDSSNTVVKEVVTSKTETGFEVELEDGTYTLTETAAEGKEIVDAQGNKYEIIPSSVTFTIENGQITSTTNTVDSKTAVDQEKGGVVREGTTFTICDAKKVVVPDKLKVKVDKKAITGDAVIENAVLKIVDSSNTVVKEVVTSKTETGFEVELEDGTYTLTETAAEGKEIVDAQGNKYEIIPSSVTFTIENGQITSTTNTVDSKTAVDQEKGGVVREGTTFTICDAKKATPAPTPTKTKVVFDKKTISGDEELAGAILTITKKGESKSQSWTSQIGKTWEVELEEGTYVLKESGDSVVDKDGNKYDVITSELEFTVNNDGTVTATGAKTAYDDKATTGYFYQNGTTIEICDAKKATSDDDSKPDGDDSSKPSDDSSKPSGGDNDGDNDSSKGNKPSGGDNDGDNDSNKGKKPSGGDNDGDNDSNKGKKPSGGDEDGDNTPNTGFAGSTFAAAALLAAVSVLAVMKKKDE